MNDTTRHIIQMITKEADPIKRLELIHDILNAATSEIFYVTGYLEREKRKGDHNHEKIL